MFTRPHEIALQIITTYKILSGRLFELSNGPLWVFEIAVGNGVTEIEGWAFIDPEQTELRFETIPGLESLLPVSSRLEDIEEIENSIGNFINRCWFCMRSLTSVSSKERVIVVDAYRYAGHTINLFPAA